MSATNNNQSLHKLTVAQTSALGVLAAGGSQIEAADAAHVHRVTVTRWANHHPAFIAELNAIQGAARVRMRTVVGRVTEKALRAVETSIEEGEVDIAVKWLRLVPGILVDSEFKGPSDSVVVVEKIREGKGLKMLEILQRADGYSTEEIETLLCQLLNDLPTGSQH